MRVIKNIAKREWENLIERPTINREDLDGIVQLILKNVSNKGDKALYEYSKQFDKTDLKSLMVSESEIQLAIKKVPRELKDAINLAKDNILKFHSSQDINDKIIETATGVKCWRKAVAIESVGLYIPGGSAPLFSTILMLGIPANIAGCKEIILCTPPNKNGEIDAVVLYTADLLGINKIFKVGGAQAIAAMAYGTETIPQVYKIFGPGNQYVTKAKELVQQYGVSIDMPAGPSELLIITDKTGNPAFIAADLLSQAEHGEDSQVILLSDDESIVEETMNQLKAQIEMLPRKEIAKRALNNSKAVVLANLKECFQLSNLYAPEHLIIAVENASNYIDNIINAGSVFLGNYSCESAGDYASGTNHTLPTNGYSKSYSGVSLDSFQKKITFQELDKRGIEKIGPAIEKMAEAEGLFAHKNAVSLRLKDIEDV